MGNESESTSASSQIHNGVVCGSCSAALVKSRYSLRRKLACSSAASLLHVGVEVRCGSPAASHRGHHPAPHAPHQHTNSIDSTQNADQPHIDVWWHCTVKMSRRSSPTDAKCRAMLAPHPQLGNHELGRMCLPVNDICLAQVDGIMISR
jgi:hypothetical protein